MSKKKDEINNRVKEMAKYFVTANSTVRATAEVFDVSKSTAHKDLRERLPKISPPLYAEVSAVLEKNWSERAIRGGMATQKKYMLMRKQTP